MRFSAVRQIIIKFMSNGGRKLNIVDEAGNIIGVETRGKIHKEGLLHREIHVWIYTPKREIIFQHREKNKDTFPDLLDASVGGHVEIGEEFIDAALKELEEEAGIKASAKELTFIQTTKTKSLDAVTGMINHALRAVYAYRYDGKVENLKVEKGKSQGFESWPFEKLFNATEEEKKRFIPKIFEDEMRGIFRKIEQLAKS